VPYFLSTLLTTSAVTITITYITPHGTSTSITAWEPRKERSISTPPREHEIWETFHGCFDKVGAQHELRRALQPHLTPPFRNRLARPTQAVNPPDNVFAALAATVSQSCLRGTARRHISASLPTAVADVPSQSFALHDHQRGQQRNEHGSRRIW